MENDQLSKTELEAICKEIIEAHPDKAKWYKEGKTVLGFFVGQAIRRTKGRSHTEIVEIMKALLSA